MIVIAFLFLCPCLTEKLGICLINCHINVLAVWEMWVPAHFLHIMIPMQKSPKIRAQNHECETRNSIRLNLLENYMLGNFLETIYWDIFGKLYAGHLLMETICREIWADTSGFLMGVIMAQCYGITLWFQGNGTRRSVEHPSSTDLTRMKRVKRGKL